jgi:hypothetical protein
MIGGDFHDKNSSINQYQERITKFSSEFELGLFLHIAKRSLIWIFLLLSISCFSSQNNYTNKYKQPSKQGFGYK